LPPLNTLIINNFKLQASFFVKTIHYSVISLPFSFLDNKPSSTRAFRPC